VPAALVAERDLFLKGSMAYASAVTSVGASAPITIATPTAPTVEVATYVGATAGASGLRGVVPAATAGARGWFFYGSGGYGPISAADLGGGVGGTGLSMRGTGDSGPKLSTFVNGVLTALTTLGDVNCKKVLADVTVSTSINEATCEVTTTVTKTFTVFHDGVWNSTDCS
jgi:hypothetical protein